MDLPGKGKKTRGSNRKAKRALPIFKKTSHLTLIILTYPVS
jgi:hypothetical protein